MSENEDKIKGKKRQSEKQSTLLILVGILLLLLSGFINNGIVSNSNAMTIVSASLSVVGFVIIIAGIVGAITKKSK